MVKGENLEKNGTVCIFTGSRAEYGLLRQVIKRLSLSEEVDLRLIVSGTHLAASYGQTEQAIIDDGFANYERVEILLDSCSDTSVCTAMALGMLRYGDVLSRMRPDLVVVLGDRFEAFAFAASATVCRIPIAHIHGGELTLGAMDDAFRHAISKMSHLHFAATEKYRKRIIQMGERADHTFNVGSLGVEYIRNNLACLTQETVEARLGISTGQPYFLVTYHPTTLDFAESLDRLTILLASLRRFPNHVAIFTGANADQMGARLNQRLVQETKSHPDQLKFFMSLGSELYLNAARYADVVVGNSSSGIIEVPSLGIPVINIGRRQQGRDTSSGIIHCDDETNEIEKSIRIALTPEFRDRARIAHNPYDKADTTDNIVNTIITFCGKEILNKGFIDIN